MKTTKRQLHDSQRALQKLSMADMPLKTALKVLNNQDRINDELKNEILLRNELLKKLGTSFPDGSTVISPENVPEFLAKESELLDVEVELTIELFTFDEIQNAVLSAADLRNLNFMISK